jgi:protein gp37
MSNETAIGWTATQNPDGTISPGFSSNPIKYRDRETGKAVWACVKKSSGCSSCYAEALALRWNKGRAFTRPNLALVEPFLDEKEMKRLATDPKLFGKRVFVGDMTDIFGSWVPNDFLDRLFAVFALRQDVTFQCLTKRPARMAAYLGSDDDVERRVGQAAFPIANDAGMDWDYRWRKWHDGREADRWPLPNVWLGTSVENQAAADERIPHLLRTPAAVRFLSCEPLLASVDLQRVRLGKLPGQIGEFDQFIDAVRGRHCDGMGFERDLKRGLDWVITGGESGPKHRTMDLDWARQIIEQCQRYGVATYVKQDSGLYPGRQGRIPDALWLHQFPEAHVVALAERGPRGG